MTAEGPFFVFTDDLAVFDTLDEAASYHEFCEPITAFDQHGNFVRIERNGKQIRLDGNKRELIRQLRRKWLLTAVSSSGRPNKWDVKKEIDKASDEDLIRWAVQRFKIPPAGPGDFLFMTVFTIAFLPIAILLMIAFYSVLFVHIVYCRLTGKN